MDVEYRAIAPDEQEAFARLGYGAFGEPAARPGRPDLLARAERERTRGAFVGGRLVGTSRSYSLDLAVPGGAVVPVAGVSWIAVAPTHRRRGILTGMLDALHADARERGEAAAALLASEGGIYGRFGYGPATWRQQVSVERAHGAFALPVADDGTLRLVADDEAHRCLPALYDRARGRPGWVSRPAEWWAEELYWSETPTFRTTVVHARADGTDDGYAYYELQPRWDGAVARGTLRVLDLVADDPRTRAALWRFVLDVDLVQTVHADHVPVDDPLRLLLADLRRMHVAGLFDQLWVCPLDAPAFLATRRYAAAGELVLGVRDADGSSERVALEGGPDGAACEPTRRTADLVCSRAALGAASLGGTTWSQLVAGGWAEELTDGARARAEAMFAVFPAPATTTWF